MVEVKKEDEERYIVMSCLDLNSYTSVECLLIIFVKEIMTDRWYKLLEK